jgi:hypothetical protein
MLTYARRRYANLRSCFSLLYGTTDAMLLHQEERLKEERRIYTEEGKRPAVGGACTGLGNCFLKQGQYREALRMFLEAREIAEEMEDRSGVGSLCLRLAICYKSLGDSHAAIVHEEEARFL